MKKMMKILIKVISMFFFSNYGEPTFSFNIGLGSKIDDILGQTIKFSFRKELIFSEF